MEKLRIEVIDWATAKMHAAKTPAEKLALASEGHRWARQVIAEQLIRLHPDWTPEQRHEALLQRMLGRGADGFLASRRRGP